MRVIKARSKHSGRFAIICGVLVIVACAADPGGTGPRPTARVSAAVLAPAASAIPGSYIVVFRSDSAPSLAATRSLTDRLA